MQWHCLSLSPKPNTSISSISPLHSTTFTHPISHFNPLRLSLTKHKLMGKLRQRRSGAVCVSTSSAFLSPRNLQWVSAVSAGILMLVRGTTINKAFLVPLFALQAPKSIVSWMQGEYGAWSAFLALLLRLFFSFPGELELPFMTLVLVMVAPLQAMNLRGTQGGIVLSLAIAAYLAFQHFTRVGSLQRAFHYDSIVATLAIICSTIVPFLLMI